MNGHRLPARVAVLDDHPAVRAGLEAMLRADPDLAAVGSAGAEDELWPLLRDARPTHLVLDVGHSGHDGLCLTLRLTALVSAPRVVLYTGRSGEEIAVAAAVAGASAVVDKSAPGHVLLDVLRQETHTAPRRVSLRARREAAELIDPADHAILAMRLAQASVAEIAETLRQPVAEIEGRLVAILRRLRRASTPLSRKQAPSARSAVADRVGRSLVAERAAMTLGARAHSQGVRGL